MRPQRNPAAGHFAGPVAQFRRRRPLRKQPCHAPALVRSGHHALRPGQQLRAALRFRRADLRPGDAAGPGAVSRRDGRFHQGRLRYVARPVRQLGVAQISAGQPGPEPGAHGAGLRGHLLPPPPGPGNAARRDHGRARPGGALRQGALCRHLQLPARTHGRGGGDSTQARDAVPHPPVPVFHVSPRTRAGAAGHAAPGRNRRHRVFAAGAGPADRTATWQAFPPIRAPRAPTPS